MLKPIQNSTKTSTFACYHWKAFPPDALLRNIPVEELRKMGGISDHDYQRYLIWERICGLRKMVLKKCVKCEYIRRLEVRNHMPVLAKLDGTNPHPIQDAESFSTFGAARSHYGVVACPPGSRNSGKNASWLDMLLEQQKKDADE